MGHNGKCYYYGDIEVTLDAAIQVCHSSDSTLASITSEAEEEFLRKGATLLPYNRYVEYWLMGAVMLDTNVVCFLMRRNLWYYLAIGSTLQHVVRMCTGIGQ